MIFSLKQQAGAVSIFFEQWNSAGNIWFSQLFPALLTRYNPYPFWMLFFINTLQISLHVAILSQHWKIMNGKIRNWDIWDVLKWVHTFRRKEMWPSCIISVSL